MERDILLHQDLLVMSPSVAMSAAAPSSFTMPVELWKMVIGHVSAAALVDHVFCAITMIEALDHLHRYSFYWVILRIAALPTIWPDWVKRGFFPCHPH